MDSALLVADKGLLFFSGALKEMAASCIWKNPNFHGIAHSLSHSLRKRATNGKLGRHIFLRLEIMQK